MSYDVELEQGGRICEVESFEDGGTYALGGTSQADFNITYNYSEVYRLFDFNIRDLHEKRAGDFIPKLQEIVDRCGVVRFQDYWAPTPGNAGHAANRLLSWAKQYPDAIFKIS